MISRYALQDIELDERSDHKDSKEFVAQHCPDCTLLRDSFELGPDSLHGMPAVICIVIVNFLWRAAAVLLLDRLKETS